MLGNTLTGVSLTLDRLLSDVSVRRAQIEALLALGATRWKAAQEVVASARECRSISETTRHCDHIEPTFFVGGDKSLDGDPVRAALSASPLRKRARMRTPKGRLRATTQPVRDPEFGHVRFSLCEAARAISGRPKTTW